MAFAQNENKINDVLINQALPALSSYSSNKKRKNEVDGFKNGISILNHSICTRTISPNVRNIMPILQFLLDFIRMSMKKIEDEYWWCSCLRMRSEYYRILMKLHVLIKQLGDELFSSVCSRQGGEQPSYRLRNVTQRRVACGSMVSGAAFLRFLSPSPLKENSFGRVVCLIYNMRLQYRGLNQKRLELCEVLEKKINQIERENRPYLFKVYIVYWTLRAAYKYIASQRRFGCIRWNTRLQKIIKKTADQLEVHLKLIDPINFRVNPKDSIYQQPQGRHENKGSLSSKVQSVAP